MNLSLLKAIVALLDAARTHGKGWDNMAEAHLFVATRHIQEATDALEAGEEAGPSWRFLEGMYDSITRLLDDEHPETPRRVQLSRQKGWKMPPNTMKVDRSTPWGNPFQVVKGATAEDAVARFRAHIEAMPDEERAAYLVPLRGRNLACWCKEGPCHAEVLLELANRR